MNFSKLKLQYFDFKNNDYVSEISGLQKERKEIVDDVFSSSATHQLISSSAPPAVPTVQNQRLSERHVILYKKYLLDIM